jgi:hypothetical protein
MNGLYQLKRVGEKSNWCKKVSSCFTAYLAKLAGRSRFEKLFGKLQEFL